ncbi:MAG TPA: mechanosensitive ion channel family protein [Gemmatimonadaceae bacterium]|nr:mechanosensitive ion channel family protein [Gemmatimonadaceae bacterium]
MAARRGDYESAADYIEAPETLSAEARARLARELELVLDRYAWLDLDRLSALTVGDTTDDLAPNVDEIAAFPLPDGRVGHVRLRRVVTIGGAGPDVAAGGQWRFSRGTVAQIAEWYATISNRWLVDRLPASLLRAGPFDLLWWQWLAALPVILVAIAIGTVAGRLLKRGLLIATRRTDTLWDDIVLERLGPPLIGLCTFVSAAALVPLLGLYAPAQAIAYRGLRVSFAAVAFWAVWRLVDVGRQLIASSRWAAALPASRSLVPLGARVAKVVVAALGAVLILSTLGYPVASLVAGLGIGGLALALAAQKTVENLFGAFSIGIDQPFREGDFVKVDDFVGTVEAIGLRSTRFRTLDRTVVTLPNGRLADVRLETFSARDRLRLAAVVGLVYETTPAQMREVLAGFERVLRSQPKIWPDAVVVRFSAFAASSLDIEVMGWFTTSDWGEFQRIREAVLLQFMDVVSAAGSAFAFPTTTVHLVSDAFAEANT